jgi:hypothetical protein
MSFASGMALSELVSVISAVYPSAPTEIVTIYRNQRDPLNVTSAAALTSNQFSETVIFYIPEDGTIVTNNVRVNFSPAAAATWVAIPFTPTPTSVSAQGGLVCVKLA